MAFPLLHIVDNGLLLAAGELLLAAGDGLLLAAGALVAGGKFVNLGVCQACGAVCVFLVIELFDFSQLLDVAVHLLRLGGVVDLLQIGGCVWLSLEH